MSQEAYEKAIRNLKTADHILNVTYPLIKDTKLLLGVVDNLFMSMTHSMGAILLHERAFKQIPPFHNNFQSKFNMLRARCVEMYKIDRKMLNTIQEVKDIAVMHRKSTVEFRRHDSFVICSDNFDTKTISAKQLKEYLDTAKKFAELAGEVIKNE